MELRTFVGPDLKETLARVKRELGPEAIILSTQSRRPAREGRDRRKWEIEVVAALPGGDIPGAGSQLAGPDSPEGFSPLLAALHQELREVKALLHRRLPQEAVPGWLEAYPEVMAFFHRLSGTGLNSQVLEKWLAQVRLLLNNHQGPEKESQVALRALMHLFPVGLSARSEKDCPRRMVLVGASGVGKTTTLAKLAIKAALVEGRRVGLISLDHERLGAVEQLAGYAHLAGLPCLSATGREELLQCLERLSNCQDIFIDSPGFNPCRPGLGEHLRHLLGDLPVECHLLLPAPASESHLALTFQAFGALPLASVLLSKVDETRDMAGCLNQLCLSGLTVSYLTTGPRVPEDVEAATAARLASLILASRRPGPEVAAATH